MQLRPERVVAAAARREAALRGAVLAGDPACPSFTAPTTSSHQSARPLQYGGQGVSATELREDDTYTSSAGMGHLACGP